ncbi:hypothetical protein B0E48_06855 [Rhodanobacter sp. C03]|nr:hypothetical protein B0E48_06855 [Rhodanobacter sp. C03]
MVVGSLLALLASTWASASPDTADPSHKQVAAFARLYGVVRYFYPGDAAQGIDWNRFAVAGVTDAQQAHGSAGLQSKLNALFGTLGPGIDIVPDTAAFPALPLETTKRPLVAWRYLGFPAKDTPYAGERTSRSGGDRFVGLANELDANPLRGKTIRLRGSIRALNQSTTTGLGLWLRTDRKGKPPGFFRNTGDSQVHDLAWHDYVITAPVGTDASILAFGFTMSLAGDAKEPAAAFRNLTLEVSDEHGGWKPVAIPDLRLAQKRSRPWFLVGSAATDNTNLSWQQTGAEPGYLVLRQHGAAVERTLFDAPPVAGKTAEFALGAGLKARVALTLTDTQARPSPDRATALQALKARLAGMPDPKTSIASGAAREADIVVAWNVFRHFYPYWDVIHVDWDRELPRALAEADKADSRAAQKRTLQRLLAPLEDAHGTVFDTMGKKQASLPIALEPVEHQWVVVATSVPDQARIGDVITSIDGVAMPQAKDQAEALASGQPSSLAWKALQSLQWGPVTEAHRFGLKHADGSASTVSLAYAAPMTPSTARPAPIAELKPGIWYVDLARTDIALFTANLAQLASARTVIYDVRGYPKDFQVSKTLPAHLLDHAEHAKWMHVPRYVGPFGELAGYDEVGWDIQPALPHFTSRAIFLADGRTISQAEAVMGYVQDEKLGTIVGATTRGVDGNVTSFEVPLGFRLIFTGMKVTHHDGVSRYHALGTVPDVAVQPTIAGVRAGRDEVLEAALKLAK